jgi:hypothetical protein
MFLANTTSRFIENNFTSLDGAFLTFSHRISSLCFSDIITGWKVCQELKC